MSQNCFHEPEISIHALREEGDPRCSNSILLHGHISIHALREEGDKMALGTAIAAGAFLSTPSARRATHSFSEQSE